MKITTYRMLILFLWCFTTVFARNIDAATNSGFEASRALFAKYSSGVEFQNLVGDHEPTLYVIGENHADVVGQMELARLINDLLDANLIDSILVEGSAGPISATLVSNQLSGQKLGSPSEWSDYWKNLVQCGQLAGYEYVLLVRQLTNVFGVEDMRAKAKYATSGRDINELSQVQKESNERALKTLQETLERTRAVSTQSRESAQSKIKEFEKAAVSCSSIAEKQLKECAPLFQTLQEEAVKQVSLVESYSETYQQLSSFSPSLQSVSESQLDLAKSIPLYNAQAKSLERKRKQLLQDLDVPKRNTLLEYGSPTGIGKGSVRKRLWSLDTEDEFKQNLVVPQLRTPKRSQALLTLRLQQFLESSRELDIERERVELGQHRIEQFFEQHSAEWLVLTNSASQLQSCEKKIETIEKQISSTYEDVEKALSKVEDSYFIAANEVLAVSNSSNSNRLAVTDFWSKEKERVSRHFTSRSSKADLKERDVAMVSNTLRYLEGTRGKSALLIVGCAHVEGIVDQLNGRKFNYVAGTLKTAKTDGPTWTHRAWTKRNDHPRPVFLGLEDRSSKEKNTKENSIVVNPVWVSEQAAKISFFKEVQEGLAGHKTIALGDAWDTRLCDQTDGKNRVIRIGKFPVDRNAEIGSQVVYDGPVPGRQGEWCEVVDLSIAEANSKRLTDEKTLYVFHHRAIDNRALRYRFLTPRGPLSLEEFVAERSKATKRIVLCGVPDEIVENSLVVSPLWRQLRIPETAAGGNGARPPGDNRKWTTASFDGEGGMNNPEIVRTINMDRAKHNIDKIDKQDSSRFGEIDFLEQPNLKTFQAQLRFTPESGDFAQMVVLVARNVSEFREAMRWAGEAKLLKNKQIGLITCGDAYAETAELRETLLSHGALMVWVPNRQITIEAGQKLMQKVRNICATMPANKRPQTINALMNMSLDSWADESSNDPDLNAFEESGSYVDLIPAAELNEEQPIVRFIDSKKHSLEVPTSGTPAFSTLAGVVG